MPDPKNGLQLVVDQCRRTVRVVTAERVARELAVVQERASIGSHRAAKTPPFCPMTAIYGHQAKLPRVSVEGRRPNIRQVGLPTSSSRQTRSATEDCCCGANRSSVRFSCHRRRDEVIYSPSERPALSPTGR